MSLNFIPRAYQQRAIKDLVANGRRGLFMQPGLGKTGSTLGAYKILKKQDMVKGVLVVASLRIIYDVWPAEIAKWTQFAGLKYHILHDKGKHLDADADIWLINHDSLPWLVKSLFLDTRAWPFDWLVIDESTRFKHTNTVRFKLLKNILPRFPRRTILTGTPTPNGLLDLFGQQLIVDDGKALGRFITHYRNEFFIAGMGGQVNGRHVTYEWTPRPDALEQITQRIGPTTTTMLTDDYLELPKLVNNNIFIDLPKKARQYYDEMEAEFILRLEKGDVVAATAGAAAIKLRQIANGAVYGDDRQVHLVHDHKLDRLESLVEELAGDPLLVVYQFDHDLQRLRERFGKDVPALHGNQTMTSGAAAIRAWNAGCPLLFAQTTVVAHGLNLQEGPGHNMAWFGMTWDYEDYFQATKRLHRSGQKAKNVFMHHLLARDTIDEVMFQVVTGHKSLSQAEVFKLLKARLHR